MMQTPESGYESTKLSKIAGYIKEIHSNAEIVSDNDQSELVKVEISDGKYCIQINESVLEEKGVDFCLWQILSNIKLFELQLLCQTNNQYSHLTEEFNTNIQKKEYKLLYGILYKFIALHDKSFPSEHYQKFYNLLNEHLIDICQKFKHYKHIQYLFGVIGVKITGLIIDEEVRAALDELNDMSFFEKLSHPGLDDGRKLQLIHEHVLVSYDYFLQQDKIDIERRKIKKQEKLDKQLLESNGEEDKKGLEGQGKPTESEDRVKIAEVEDGSEEDEVDPKEVKSDQIEEDLGEDIESEAQNEQDESNPQGTDDDEEEDTPDHQSTYKTTDGGQFEKSPNKKGYKLEIDPFSKAYHVSDYKSYYDKTNKEWSTIAKLNDYTRNPEFIGNKFTISGKLKGQGIKSIPIPQGYALNIHSLTCTGNTPIIYRDENGAFYMKLSGHDSCNISIDFYKEKNPTIPPVINEDKIKIYQGNLSQNAETAMQHAKMAMSTRNYKKAAGIIRDYIRQYHAYPYGKNDEDILNNAKKIQKILKDKSSPENYIENLDKAKHLECYSANTLMVAMLRNIGMPARVIIGHHIQQPNEDGNGEINAANCHGWCVIWDESTRNWIRFDATPDQDPNDPRNQKDQKGKDADQKKEQNKKNTKKGDDIDDGGEDTKPPQDTSDDKEEKESKDGEEGGESKEGKEGEKSEDGQENGESDEGKEGKKSENGQESGESKEGKEEGKNKNDPDEEYDDKYLEKMYDELDEEIKTLDPQKIEEAQRDFQQREKEKEKEDIRKAQTDKLTHKYSHLDQERMQYLLQYIEQFRRDIANLRQLPNPDDKSKLKTLEAVFKDMFSRIVTRRLKEEPAPKYPIADGADLILFNPVQLALDERNGLTDSTVYIDTQGEVTQTEELRIIGVDIIEVLDGSGSMDPNYFQGGDKMRTQQAIVALQNSVVADKQKEINKIADTLKTDLKLRTQTLQFGGVDPFSHGHFTELKPLSSEFDELEQAHVWAAATNTKGGTNDFDPLQMVHDQIMAEQNQDLISGRKKVPTLSRIRIGFLIREMKAYEELKRKGSHMNSHEAIHFHNLSSTDPNIIFFLLQQFIPNRNDADPALTQQELNFLRANPINSTNAQNVYDEWFTKFSSNKFLTKKESQCFKKLKFNSKNNLFKIYQLWQSALVDQYGEDKIDPLLKIIEVTTDGQSDNKVKLQEILTKLRNLGCAVIGYGLGSDGSEAMQSYANTYNPYEGGYHCRNILDYPRTKVAALQYMLDRT